MPRKKKDDDEELDNTSFHIAAERKEVTTNISIDGQTVARNTIKRDPLQLKVRLYAQVGELLHQLEGATDEPITVRERIAALVAIGRLQDLLLEKAKDDDENAGSAIRKYASAFTENGASRRKKTIGFSLVESDSRSGDRLDDDLGDGD